ncbi:MAG: hypothetical protein KC503_44760 [Myxococcales bacterium]|nr:hypothetical protein [Myxococcales bacterium]
MDPLLNIDIHRDSEAVAHPALATQRISLALELEAALDRDALITALHRFIRDDHFADEIPVDVANYAHLADGPQVLLICHYGQLSYDVEGELHTLRWSSRRTRQRDFETRLRHAADVLLRAARLLGESDGVDLRARQGVLRFAIRDRLAAPDSAETRAAVEPYLASLAETLGVTLQLVGHASSRRAS